MADPNQELSTRKASETEALRRIRRRWRRWFLIKLFAALAIVLLGLVLYLQSSHALIHLYLPLLSERLGTALSASGGSLHLNGQVEMDKPVLMGRDGQPAFVAEQLVLKVVPSSLLPGRLPVIEMARVKSPEVRIRKNKQGETNWDFAWTPARPGPSQAAVHSLNPMTRRQAYPAIQIGQLQVSDLSLDYADDSGRQGLITTLDLTAGNFGRGQSGTVKLGGAGSFRRPADKLKQEGTFALQGSFKQSASGDKMSWEGAFTAGLKGVAPALAGTQAVDIKSDFGGAVTIHGQYRERWNLTATTPQGPAGSCVGNIAWDEPAQSRQAEMTLSGVGDALLNPILAALGPVQLTSSTLEARCNLAQNGDAITVESEIQGRDLSFKVGANPTATAPMQLAFTQHGVLTPGRHELRIDAMNLGLQVNHKPIAEAHLDQPMTVATAPGGGGGTIPAAQIKLNANDLTAEVLRPWLVLAGVPEKSVLQAGALSGQATITVDHAGQRLALEGTFAGLGLVDAAWGDQSIDVHKTVHARLDELQKLTFDPSTVNVDRDGQRLADLEVSGAFQLDKKEGEFQLALNAPQTLAAARAMGWLKPDQLARWTDGRLEATQKIQLTMNGTRVQAEGNARLNGLSVPTAAGDSQPLAATAYYSLTLSGHRLALSPVHIELTRAAKAKPEVLEIKGEWPLGSAPGEDGELKLTAQGLDLAPWLRLHPAFENSAVEALPIEVDEVLTAQEGGRMKLAGQLRAGPLSAPDGSGQSVSVTLRTEGEKTGEALDKLVLDLASRTADGAEDKVYVEGSGQLGAQPQIKLKTRIESLTLEPYLALLGGKTRLGQAPASPESNPAATSATLLRAAREQVPAMLELPGEPPPPSPLVIESALTLKQLKFRKSELSEATGEARWERGVLTMKVEAGKFNGGTVKGDLELDRSRQEPRYAWNLALKEINTQALAESIDAAWGDKLAGKGELTSRGAGQGTAEAFKRHLQSDTSFMITNGELKHIALLDRLAQQTKMPAFQTLRFKDFNGQLNIDGGVATLKDWNERGPEQMLTMDGKVGLDGTYDLTLQPAVSGELAKRFGDRGLPTELLTDQQGYLRFPFQLAVSGKGADVKMKPQVGISSASGGKTRDRLRGALGGLIAREAEKAEQRKLKKQRKEGLGADENATPTPETETPGTPAAKARIKPLTRDLPSSATQEIKLPSKHKKGKNKLKDLRKLLQ